MCWSGQLHRFVRLQPFEEFFSIFGAWLFGLPSNALMMSSAGLDTSRHYGEIPTQIRQCKVLELVLKLQAVEDEDLPEGIICDLAWMC